jgi:hypothetical protein
VQEIEDWLLSAGDLDEDFASAMWLYARSRADAVGARRADQPRRFTVPEGNSTSSPLRSRNDHHEAEEGPRTYRAIRTDAGVGTPGIAPGPSGSEDQRGDQNREVISKNRERRSAVVISDLALGSRCWPRRRSHLAGVACRDGAAPPAGPSDVFRLELHGDGTSPLVRRT